MREGATGRIRRPAHAGSFYPADERALGRLVDELVAEAARGQFEGTAATPTAGEAPGVAESARPLGLVVPHAGLVFSGAVAAAAWSTLRDRPPRAIVIAGTNHYDAYLDGVAAWPGGAWSTPLGDVPVDGDLADRIASLGPGFEPDAGPHVPEHSIEVQLPLVARLCPGVPIVPILVSFHSTRGCEEAGRRLGMLLAGLEGDDVVLVASSDFAHYPAAAETRRATQTLLPPLLALDVPGLARTEDQLRHAGVRNLVCGLCGLDPVLFSMAAFREMGATAGDVLAEATSADSPYGDPYRCVGYAAIAFRHP